MINEHLSGTDTAQMTDYVVYYRVSTERQGKSGLGLEAQRSMIEAFLQPGDAVIEEYTEIQSGKKDDRVKLWKAINLVKKTKAKLLIPKLDRFSRKVSFIAGIIDQGVDLVVCEHPNVNTFFLHLLACFAEEERRQVSERTKAALKAAKNRGVVLGRHGSTLAAQRRALRRNFAMENAIELRASLAEAGSLAAAARLLNEKRMPTVNGGRWHPQSVKNYLALIPT